MTSPHPAVTPVHVLQPRQCALVDNKHQVSWTESQLGHSSPSSPVRNAAFFPRFATLPVLSGLAVAGHLVQGASRSQDEMVRVTALEFQPVELPTRQTHVFPFDDLS